VVRRPGLANAPKNKSKLRVSFGPGQTGADEDLSEGGDSVIKAPKRANLVKQAAGNNLLKRSWSPSRPLEHATPRSGQDDDRPTYSKDYLNELRNSTPSTPRDLSSYTSEDDDSSKALDVLSKFGAINEETNKSAIPTEAEIREKKERRARLAKEQDFISLEDEGDGRFMQLSARKEPKETRLVRDDEDLAEGFDDYVEDAGRVALGKKAKAAQQRKEREAMRDMIADAENISDEDDSEAERNLAYETAQTRNAMDGLGLNEERNDGQARAPTIITPIPRLSSVLDRLRSNISNLEYKRAKLFKQMADLQQEKAEIAVREVEIQRLLREAGERYEQLRAESNTDETRNDEIGSQAQTERGLETMGNT
jgi:Nineteen complex-related protein 2